MREYTYDELQRMQEKALERVRNMQLHSKEVVEETNRAMESQSPPLPRTPASCHAGNCAGARKTRRAD